MGLNRTPDEIRRTEVYQQTRKLAKQQRVKGETLKALLRFAEVNEEVPEVLRGDGYERIPDPIYAAPMIHTVTYPDQVTFDRAAFHKFLNGWELVNESDPSRGRITATRVTTLGLAGAGLRKGAGKITVTWYHPATELVSGS